MSADTTRLNRLNRQFDLIVQGKTQLSQRNYLQFLEAIYSHSDPATRVSKLIAGDNGLPSIQAAMRIDLSPKFFNDTASLLLECLLGSRELSDIGGGDFLRRVLLSIVEPPIFWTAFVQAFKQLQLQEQATLAFARLLLQLLLLPSDVAIPYRDLAQNSAILDPLTSSPLQDIRAMGEKIKHIVEAHNTGVNVDIDFGPGGRHDNDKIDFRQIAILPTVDEVSSKEAPFLRPCAAIDDPDTQDTRAAIYLDNTFRLLREDMLYELRDELQVALGDRRKKHRNVPVDGLKLLSAHHEIDIPDRGGWRRGRWSISLQVLKDLPQLKKVHKDKRKEWLRENYSVLRHRSMACLLVSGKPVAFATINRDEELLAQNPPVIILQLEGEAGTVKALLKLKLADSIKLVQVDSSMFAFEPVLRAIQEMHSVPLDHELLHWSNNRPAEVLQNAPAARIADAFKADPNQDLQGLLNTGKQIILDQSQGTSFLSGLTQTIALIQGPPGTGKSFIGALLAKALHDFTSETILVVCYTNHALDQFLEDLLDIGIPESSMLRLGGKYTSRTEPLLLQNVKKQSNLKFNREDWKVIDSHKKSIQNSSEALKRNSARYMSSSIQQNEIFEYLEFEAPDYFDAFQVPLSSDGMQRVTKGGKKATPYYLLDSWRFGHDGGIFKDAPNVVAASDIWKMSPSARRTKYEGWEEELCKEQVLVIHQLAKQYNDSMVQLERKMDEGQTAIIRSRRIIGCTTTAAAMYRNDIRAASPGVLLVEEAGEILESHVLTALAPETKQLILIGDHQQLRPKVNHYLLTVEKGEGYDLNRSLFERLVRKGYPHETLRKQHRMRPEISELVRHLTYPDLVDADSTLGRPGLRGVRDTVVFIQHEKPEDDHKELRPDQPGAEAGSKSSKSNQHEVEMVLKIVRYLAQQGYGTEKVVILTPYLGQLRALQQAMKDTHDPILNDLDSADLVRAGLVSAASAKLSKKPIRLATIDNYQGEESDIVVISLTRSNSDRQIGFMSSPERVNVLLSRARNALIMIGNARTFREARGGEIWAKLFKLLISRGHVYDGLPAQCDRHPDRKAILQCADDFDQFCPDGGCAQPCGTILPCSHPCPSKCHQISDHSKMQCEKVMLSPCSSPKRHQQQWKCFRGPPDTCPKCEKEAKAAEKKALEDFARQEKQDREQREHEQRMAEIDAKTADQREIIRAGQLAEERKEAILRKQRDLRDAESLAARASAVPSAPDDSPSAPSAPHTPPPSESNDPEGLAPQSAQSGSEPSSHRPPPEQLAGQSPKGKKGTRKQAPPPAPPPRPSLARADWERQKTVDGASNEAIDDIMDMTGLEKVKAQVLAIKAQVDTAKRQGTSLQRQRFNVAMLGNPGTGKTTIARLYARFLASIQILPGNMFIETTGSRLANEGTAGIKKQIESVIEAGGGTIFCDEAYQLTSQHNVQGSQVLDFLLAEMENNIGKIVFIFAGYNKEMEKFFEHNPGLTSRVPYTLQFDDYNDDELMEMLEKKIAKEYSGRMKVEDVDGHGIRGLFGRIAIRRLGRGRGRDGFGNARALENLLARIRERQSRRIEKDRQKGQRPDDFLLIGEDLIGPDPSTVMVESTDYKKLQEMIGLTAVKAAVANLLFMVKSNYDRELLEKEPHSVSLNRVFLGSPGTGKTTVAKLYGRILADLGLISRGEVVVKNPADFIGSALGQSESQTKAILATTVGKVLVIDEAYMLYGGKGANSTVDPYKTAVIDTIVAEVQSVPGEDRCVLLLGYKDQMEEMFQNVNPGLSRRFAIESAFHFHDYTDPELLRALDLKLKTQDLSATDDAKRVAIEVLARARNRPNFGNIGEVENLLSKAKVNYQQRQATMAPEKRSPDAPFEPQDFDPDFNRSDHAGTNLAKLFEDVVGCEDVVRKLEKYQQVARTAKTRGKDPRSLVPTNFVFRGPPGTGKTTTARKMGQVYYDMGLLSSAEVIECSASDLVGRYVGETGPKTKGVFEKALGRVLFIDEAYRLAEGAFAKEAMDELVGILTQEAFKGKLIVVLAGYDKEMDDLLSVNPGLSSRFPDSIVFRNIPAHQCLEILRRELSKQDIRSDALEHPQSPEGIMVQSLIEELSELPSWGNARDLQTLAKQMVTVAYTMDNPLNSNPQVLEEEDVIDCLNRMLSERRPRASRVPTRASEGDMQQFSGAPTSTPRRPFVTAQTTTVAAPPSAPRVSEETASATPSSYGRDPGVSDAVWAKLQADKLAAALALQQAADTERRLAEELQRAHEREVAHMKVLALLAAKRAKDDAEAEELKRLREEERLRELAARAERNRIEAALKARREEEARKRKEEAKAQAKLQQLGLCEAGFQWIKQSDGYRCSAGGHFVGNGQLGI